jgi:hypothetical protein
MILYKSIDHDLQDLDNSKDLRFKINFEILDFKF